VPHVPFRNLDVQADAILGQLLDGRLHDRAIVPTRPSPAAGPRAS
jgi:hypothetical protein